MSKQRIHTNIHSDDRGGCVFWGKFLPKGPRCLPLAAHCLDVALVFRGLTQVAGLRRALQHAAGGVPLDDVQLDRLAVLAMLHDIGKANLGFQQKVFAKTAPRAGHIRELEPLFDFEDEQLHQALLRSLPDGLEGWFPDGEVAYSYFLATFSHHGRPVVFRGMKTGTYWPARTAWWRPQGTLDPMAAIAQIGQWARAAFPGAFQAGGPPLPHAAPFHHRFAGLVMLADWLGSHSQWFPVQETSLPERLAHGRHVVPRLLQAVGLDVTNLRPALPAHTDFQGRFGFPPRPLQDVLDRLDVDSPNTQLVIAESETGSGKTEAALNWFFKLFRAGKVDGLYFALPTRVAAQELYARVHNTIVRWFPDPQRRPVTVRAVPGYPQVDGLPLTHQLPDAAEANLWHDDEATGRRERQWAAEQPKRFLAATVAVGTIDQALLSAVQTGHAHLRSVSLDRHLLVVDEVHASDVYVARLLQHLLQHHRHVGGYALLLSATLGMAARHQYTRPSEPKSGVLPPLAEAAAAPYPSITLSDGSTYGAQRLTQKNKAVQFLVAPDASRLETLAKHVLPPLAAGARVLVILNTVARANEALRALESHPDINPDWIFRVNGVPCPHHGRFAPGDRLHLDRAVTRRFAADGLPGPVVLVGTQTLEQSLDIDADFLITDLAPADVLLQRAGRLHRHPRPRPPGWHTPQAVILAPDQDLVTGLDARGEAAAAFKQLGCGSVYPDLRVLALTLKALQKRPTLEIPEHNRWFVEYATHPEQLASLPGPEWARHGQLIDGGELAQAIAAGHAAAMFKEYFGEREFNEAGGKVVTRLGAHRLQLPVDRPFNGPFGQRIESVIIPGHLAPADPADIVQVLHVSPDAATLQCGSRRYQYSRFGLEAASR